MNFSTTTVRRTLLGSLLLFPLLMGSAQATGKYRITVKNLTYSQVFSPILVVGHSRRVALFESGEAASEPLAQLAEGGATQPLIDALAGNRNVFGTATSGGPVLPGQSVTIDLKTNYISRISVASMLVNTNDAFLALNSVRAPYRYKTQFEVPAYDAGSERNDELCVHIPGPLCAGMNNEQGGILGDPGEGFVHIHRGIHGIGNLDRSVADWRNPVAEITIKRIR